MRRRDLLTQVLAANLLLIVAAVIGAVLATNPEFDLSDRPEAGVVLGFAIAFTVVLNISLLQRRFGPLERLVDEMERADLTRPGANLRTRPTREARRRSRGCTGRSCGCSSAWRPSVAAPRAPPWRPKKGAGPGGPRPPRRGQPVADRLAAAAGGRAREGAARARRRARRDPRARQPGDGGAAHPGAPAATHGPRRPRPGGRARRARTRAQRAGDQRRRSSPRATSGDCQATRSSSSTGSPRRRSPTRSATRTPTTCGSACGATGTTSN